LYNFALDYQTAYGKISKIIKTLLYGKSSRGLNLALFEDYLNCMLQRRKAGITLKKVMIWFGREAEKKDNRK
jgi:hypothetical protein